MSVALEQPRFSVPALCAKARPVNTSAGATNLETNCFIFILLRNVLKDTSVDMGRELKARRAGRRPIPGWFCYCTGAILIGARYVGNDARVMFFIAAMRFL